MAAARLIRCAATLLLTKAAVSSSTSKPGCHRLVRQGTGVEMEALTQ